jgi:hypothetical protein
MREEHPTVVHNLMRAYANMRASHRQQGLGVERGRAELGATRHTIYEKIRSRIPYLVGELEEQLWDEQDKGTDSDRCQD